MLLLSAQAALALNTESGFGARASAMGNAFTAAANDSYALYYNPAGLALITSVSAGSTYADYYSGLTDGTSIYETDICLAVPDVKSGFGFYWQETGLGSYYSEDTLAAGYAMRPLSNLAVGACLKIRSVSYAAVDATAFNSVFNSLKGASAFSFDAGLIFNAAPGLNLGLAALDILQPDLGIADKSIIPLTLRGGVSWYPFKGGERRNLLLAADIVSSGGSLSYAAGVEAWVLPGIICVRGGYTLGDGNLNQASGGAGIKLSGLLPGITLMLDYAFDLPLGYSDLGLNHRISLGAVFEK